ncbi:MAG TPA: NUDIX domain-containing protein, partial [Candidatus Dormibacteraeota bacterium]|nr:NUDIX domain-containing protein [Candidatus Dormibacteraeota bacterium]
MSDYMKNLRALVGNRLLLVPAVMAVIRDSQSRILLQRRAEDGHWSMPAGSIDPGESPAAAIVREVREETGLEVEPRRVLGVFGGPLFRERFDNGDEGEFTIIVFECVPCGGVLAATDPETAELRYFSSTELPKLHRDYPRTLFTE